MSNYGLFKDLTPLSTSLETIFLDPNNPRFVGPKWIDIPDEEIDSEAVQDAARLTLVKEHGIDKLRMNMEVNGYLPIDRIIVREFKPGKYVVLEGNRRICAAKMIGPIGIDGTSVSEEILDSFRVIPCLQYTGTEQDASWIFQGPRHITGISEWSAYNKARLLVEQMEEEKISLTEAGKRFGLTPFGAGQWVRGYFAFQQGRTESDYVQEVDERAYPYFQEMFSKSSSPVRDWIEWDESKGKGQYRFKNLQRLNELVGWLYPRRTGEDGEEAVDARGEWDKRYLKTRDDLRQLSYLISSAPKYFEEFRRDHDLERSYAMATAERYQQEFAEKADTTKTVFDALSTCIKVLDELPLKILRDHELNAQLQTRLADLEALVRSLRGTTVNASGS